MQLLRGLALARRSTEAAVAAGRRGGLRAGTAAPRAGRAAIPRPCDARHHGRFQRTRRRAPPGTKSTKKPLIRFKALPLLLWQISADSVSGEAWEPEGMARDPLPMREPACRDGRGFRANRRKTTPGRVCFRGRSGSASLGGVYLTDPCLSAAIKFDTGDGAASLGEANAVRTDVIRKGKAPFADGLEALWALNARQ